MNIVLLETYLRSNSICVGCLSSERKLSPISHAEVTTIFCEVFNTFNETSTISLCWECDAIIKKVVKFKQRVKHGGEYLLECLHKNTKPLSLSNLKTINTELIECTTNLHKIRDSESLITCNTQNLTPETQTRKGLEIEENPPYLRHETINSDQCSIIQKSHNGIQKESHKDLQNGVKSPYFHNKSCNTQGTKITQNLYETNLFTFIKVENDEIDDDIGDENLYQYNFSNDEEDLKIFVKEDTDTGFTNNGKCIKLKANTDKEDFNESDDEPLNFKKKKQKQSRKKMKKDVVSSEKVVKRKEGKGKREQQAGVVCHPRVDRILQQLNVDPSQMQMVILGWDEIQAEREKGISDVSFTRHKYKCHDCVVGFNHKFKFDNHMKKHDESSGKVVCSVCKIRCKDDGALRAHRRRHRVRWRCCICGELWSRAPVAADHVARTHGAPPPTHVCKLCGHTESSLGKLRSHMKNHGERSKCDLCEKTFRDRASLKTHLFIHKGEKEYSCPHCGKRFLFKKAMEVHMVTHDASAHLYCHQCDMNFKNRMSYNQHIKYNLRHIDPSKLKYACKLCDKKFAKSKRLEEHNVAVHLNAKPINCTAPECSFTCSSRPVLRTHVRMVHRNARAQRNHVCHTCGKAYTTKKTLEGHMRSHSGERPFRCPHCPSAFGYEAALYNHNKLVHLKAKIGRNTSSYHQQSKETPEKVDEIS